MQYSDLHRHLDGSLRPSTVTELAARAGLEVPADLPFTPGMGLHAALSRFAFTLSLLKTADAVRRVASEMCEDAEANGVTTLEIRFAPHLHVDASLEEVVDGALEGIDGRAGLILCGLYGEDPAILDAYVSIAEARPGVVGIDLAGGPTLAHEIRLEDYAAPFRRAEKLGVGRTVHAGEGRPPDEIRVAIEQLHAQRIGHGTTLLDDPSVVELVVRRQVVIEVCATSNWHTGILASPTDHPVVAWLSRGVKAAVCTDNTLLSQVDAPTEWSRIASIEGMTPSHLETLRRTGHEARFQRG